MVKNKNIAVIIAFALPVVFIVLMIGVFYLPSLSLSTDYDFIYASCGDGTDHYPFYQCDNYLKNLFSVQNGVLVENDININLDSDKDGVPDIDENYKARVFLHETETNESREITIEYAKSLNLSDLLTSPDGVSVSSSRSGGTDFFLLFNSGGSYGQYLVKGNSRKKLNLINSDDSYYYYRDNFNFLGWVLE